MNILKQDTSILSQDHFSVHVLEPKTRDSDVGIAVSVRVIWLFISSERQKVEPGWKPEPLAESPVLPLRQKQLELTPWTNPLPVLLTLSSA